MGLCLFLGALAAILPAALSAAMEPNLAAPSGSHPPRPKARFIEYPSIKCTFNSVDPYDISIAKDKIVAWGEEYKIGWRDSQLWTHGTAAFQVCNCGKWFAFIEEEEVDEVLGLLEWWCGVGRSGWVWNGLWNKGYSLESAEAWRASQRCPESCIATRNYKALGTLKSE